MVRRQKLEGGIRLSTFAREQASYQQLEIPVERSDLESLLLNLSLLSYNLIERLVLSSSCDSVVIRRASTAKLTSGRGRRELELSQRELEFVCSFLLVYYRDEAADVDHIDIEVASEEAESTDITFQVDRSKPPMTADEARTLLGGDC